MKNVSTRKSLNVTSGCCHYKYADAARDVPTLYVVCGRHTVTSLHMPFALCLLNLKLLKLIT